MIKRGNFNEIRPLLESYLKSFNDSFGTMHKKAKQAGIYRNDFITTNLVGDYKPFILAGYPGVGKKTLIDDVLGSKRFVYSDRWFYEGKPDNLSQIFEYLASPGVNDPILRIDYISDDFIEEISDKGYDVHVLTFDREIFFEWAEKLSAKGHRNVDKLFLDYLKDNPDDTERDWKKLIFSRSKVNP